MVLMRTILLAISFVTMSAFAGETPKQLHFSCVTEFPTTSFISPEFSTDGKLKMTLLNHNGVGYMPVHNGLVTVNDINVMAERAKMLEKVGKQVNIEFELANCKVYTDKSFSCYNGTKFKAGGTEFDAFSVWSAKNDLRFNDIHFEQWTMTLSLIVDGTMYHIPMMYYGEECRFDFGDLGGVNLTPKSVQTKK